MTSPVRPYLAAGVAAMTALTVALTPSASEPAQRESTVSAVRVASPPLQLTAAVEPLAVTDLPDLLAGWVQRIVVPPSATAPLPEPDFPPVVVANSIGSAIINTYNAIEPWVQYGFELATYAVGWIPGIGWLAPQIMIFYNFGESITSSVVYNFAFWVDGQVNFVQGLTNIAVDTVNAFIQLGIDQWNFWLPPLPPFPPFLVAAEPAQAEPLTAAVAEESSLEDLSEPSVAVPDDLRTLTGEVAPDDAVHEPQDSPTDDTSDVPDTERSTDTSGTVSAQGEIRGSGVDLDEVTDDAPTTTADENDPVSADEAQGTEATAALDPTAPSPDDAGTAGSGGADGASATE